MKRIYTFLAALMCLAGSNVWAEGYDALTIVGGVAQISSAADWDNFVIAVNTDKHYNLNAVLTKDITLTDPVTITAGSTYSSKSSKYTDNGYTGTFDGQFHTLTYTKTTTAAGWGLFARLYGGTIKNLNVAGTLTANHGKSAGLVNTVSGSSRLQNVNVSVNTEANTENIHGGIARLVDGAANFIGCVYSGTITGSKATSCNALAYNNYNTSNFKNCAVISNFGPTDAASYILTRGGTGQLARCSNCYYLSTISGPSVNSGSMAITAEQIASGFLAEQLNLDQTFPAAWRQTLGADAAPVLDPDHGIVNKVSAAGYTTQYIADCDVEIPSGVTAYAGSVSGDYLSLTEIGGGKIKAGSAVVLKGSAGYYSFVPTTGAADVAANALQGSDGSATGGDGIFALSQKGDPAVVGFYPVDSSVKIPAGKAYLSLGGSSVKGFYGFRFGDENPTAVDGIQTADSEDDIYNLSGQRININNVRARKGIYIVRGKKVLF